MYQDENKLSLLPTYTVGIEELIDGIVIKYPKYCKRKKNDRCHKYYKEIYSVKNEGIYLCPYGFNSYIYKHSDTEIYTGLRIEGKFDKKKTNPKMKNDYMNKIITVDELEKYIQYEHNQYGLLREHLHLKEFIGNTFHDFRSFNTHIKNKSNMALAMVNGKKGKFKKFGEGIKNIWAMSEFITMRLNSYDALFLPQSSNTGNKDRVNTFRIFDKVRKCFENDGRKKKTNIKLTSNGECGDVRLNENFELVSYLLIDNAMKYSLNNKNINVYINDNVDRQQISIDSISPKINKDEIEKLCIRGFRGSNARMLGIEGSGIGMYLVKDICDSNNIKLDIDSNDEIVGTYNGIEYSNFTITLTIIK